MYDYRLALLAPQEGVAASRSAGYAEDAHLAGGSSRCDGLSTAFRIVGTTTTARADLFYGLNWRGWGGGFWGFTDTHCANLVQILCKNIVVVVSDVYSCLTITA
jgi:hypothetical protein